MKKLSAFWYVFKRSLTDPEYYPDVLRASFVFSLKYLYVLLISILAVKAIIFSIALSSLFPRLPQFVIQARAAISQFYPNELVMTINNGSLRTNVDEPYTVPFPKSLNITDTSFAVIDTKASVEDFKKYKTVMFVTKNAIAYPDSNTTSGYRVQPLSDMKGYRIFTRQSYNKITSAILPYLNYAPSVLGIAIILILVVFPLLGSVFYLAGIMFYLVILTVFLYFMTKLMKRNLSYSSLYRLGMHGVTFSLLFDLLKSFFGIVIPFTFVMPYFIWMLIVLSRMKTPYGTNVNHKKSA